MSAVEHISGTPTDDEVWALAIAKCEKAERNYWLVGLLFGGVAFFELALGFGSPSHIFGFALGSGAWALIIKLDVQYWRLIGFAPSRPYWRRVADLAPQFVAVGVAGVGLFVVIDEVLRPGTEEEAIIAWAMGVGASIGLALALGLSFCVDMKTARRWIT